jgi:hypothetical protein
MEMKFIILMLWFCLTNILHKHAGVSPLYRDFDSILKEEEHNYSPQLVSAEDGKSISNILMEYFVVKHVYYYHSYCAYQQWLNHGASTYPYFSTDCVFFRGKRSCAQNASNYNYSLFYRKKGQEFHVSI